MIYKKNKIEKISLKDWFYLEKREEIEKEQNELIKKIENFFVKKENKKIFNEKKEFLKYEFEQKDREIINKLIKQIKENLNEEKKELFKKSIYELDIPQETKLFLRNLEAINEEEIKSLKKVAFDLEIWSENFPNPNNDPIVLASFYGEDIKKVLVLKEKNPDLKKIEEINKEKNIQYEIEIVDNERELIKKTINILEKYDLIFSYNGDNFDFYFLKERAKKFKLKEYEKIEVKGVEEKKSTIIGKTHLDLFVFVKNIIASSLKSELLNLDQVSKEILNEGKDGNWKFIKDINYLIPYNFKDSYLTYKLGMHFLPLIVNLSKIINQPLFKTVRSTYGKLVEYKLMKEAETLGVIIPQQPNLKEIKKRDKISYEGAFVYEPKYGIYENIAVLDFQSLYPSIIATFNICPTTLKEIVIDEKEDNEILEDEEHFITPVINYFGKKIRIKFSKEKGFIPTIIKKLFEQRVEAKKELKKMKENKESKEKIDLIYWKQYSLKILINSIYGYLGYSRSRWFSIECAMAITAFGRYFIKKVIELAEKKGFKVIYGDTDSLFLIYKSKKELFDFLEEVNNKILPGLMKLDLENFYKRGLFVPLKSEEKGAKKKYALIDENNKIKIRGFETVRRDWAILTKEVQNKIIELILKGEKEKAKEFFLEIINKLKNKEIPKEKLVIYTQLRKDLEEYESQGPHVKLANKLKKMGINVKKGMIIGYIVGEGKGNIGDRVFLLGEDKDYDVNYYLNNQLIPAVERIFEIVGINVKELIENKKQKNIFSFLRK